MQWILPLDGVEYAGRPLSAEAVRVMHLALIEAGEDGEKQDVAIQGLLRRAFPLRWSFLWGGDPVRKLLRKPDKLIRLAAFLAVPAEATKPVREPDEWDRLEEMQRGEDEPLPAVTLETACRITECAFGASWYFNRDRWSTWDGYAPLDVVWRAWKTLHMTRAFERVNMIRAIYVTKAGEKSASLYDATVAEALNA